MNQDSRKFNIGLFAVGCVLGLGLIAVALGFMTMDRFVPLTDDNTISESSIYFLKILRILVGMTGVLVMITAGYIASPPPAAGGAAPHSKNPVFELFVVSFLILFMELALIRWLPAYVKLMTYFTNFILIAAFLGMGLGCIATKFRFSFLRVTPMLLAIITMAAMSVFVLSALNAVNYSLAHMSSEGEIYFGGVWAQSGRVLNLGVNTVIGILFVLTTLAFIGPGQVMGRLFDRFDKPILAYSVNVGASIAGILCFTMFSFLRVPAYLWFASVAVMVLWLMAKNREGRTIWQVGFLGLMLVIMVIVNLPSARGQIIWSPYYKIEYRYPGITVNMIGHQSMKDYEGGEVQQYYRLPFLLARDVQKRKYDDVLVIGAGSGNDVAASLRYNAESVDAVEIEPVILKIGMEDHPNKPYSDERVTRYNNDARSYLRHTDKKYDMIIYALVDSLALMGNMSSVRLESYLFTREAFEDVKAHLKPGGVFLMHNYFREPWLTHRLNEMLKEVFGEDPVLVILPALEELKPDSEIPYASSLFMVGDVEEIKAAFREHGAYYVWDDKARFDYNFDGFNPPDDPGLTPVYMTRIGKFDDTRIPVDDWPFVYMKQAKIPGYNLAGLLMVAVVSLVLVACFNGVTNMHRISMHYFFLGAAFMLLETQGIVKLALIHGSTWLVNSVVFITVLLMIFLANIYVLKKPIKSSLPLYVLLIASIALNYFVPLDVFLGKGPVMEFAGSGFMLFTPIIFAGVIFANSFRASERPALDLGSNLLGIICGGLLEYLSIIKGYHFLLLLAAGLYILSLVFLPRGRRA